MKARDYAISLGLAKPGKGKLSFQAHTAIRKAIADGVNITDYKGQHIDINKHSVVNSIPVVRPGNDISSSDGSISGPHQRTRIPDNKINHEYNTIYGIDTRGRSPLVIAFQYCSGCARQVIYCSHDIPQLPGWIGGGNGLIDKPTEEEAWARMASANLEN